MLVGDRPSLLGLTLRRVHRTRGSFGFAGGVPESIAARQFPIRDQGHDAGAPGASATTAPCGFMLQRRPRAGRGVRLSLAAATAASGLSFADSATGKLVVLGVLPDQSASFVHERPERHDRGRCSACPPTARPTWSSPTATGATTAGLGVDAAGSGTFTLADRRAPPSRPSPSPTPDTGRRARPMASQPGPRPREAARPKEVASCGSSSPAAPASSARTSAIGCWPRATRSSASTTSSPAAATTSSTCSTIPRFELLRHDVCEPLFIEVDQIYNLACPASPVHYQYNPVKTVKSNVMGTLNMLVLAKRVGARILQASTSEVYGDPTVHPQPESYWGNVNPIGPRACYDEGKRVAETLMSDYHREDGVDIRIARIFNTYGPRMAENDGRVVSNFIVQALRGQELTLYGTGEQTRSFCYVDDLVDGLVRLMNAEGRHEPGQPGQPGRVHHPGAGRAGGEGGGRRGARHLSGRCRRTTRPSASPTSPARASGSAGSRRMQLAEGLVRTVAYFRQRLSRRNRAAIADAGRAADVAEAAGLGGRASCGSGDSRRASWWRKQLPAAAAFARWSIRTATRDHSLRRRFRVHICRSLPSAGRPRTEERP